MKSILLQTSQRLPSVPGKFRLARRRRRSRKEPRFPLRVPLFPLFSLLSLLLFQLLLDVCRLIVLLVEYGFGEVGPKFWGFVGKLF